MSYSSEPKVSIIIPVYNGEKYVEFAINSALNQTYKNIEVIVVDDGSTDSTSEILKKYTAEVRVFHKANGGVATALNLGIQRMTGEYFSWLSHDDLYRPEKIEAQVQHLMNYPHQSRLIAISNYTLVDDEQNLLNEIHLKYKTDVLELANCIELLAYSELNGCTLLIPKAAFEISKFSDQLRYTQDYDLWLKLILNGYRFLNSDSNLVFQRIHKNQDSLTKAKSPQMLMEKTKLYHSILTFIAQSPDISQNKKINLAVAIWRKSAVQGFKIDNFEFKKIFSPKEFFKFGIYFRLVRLKNFIKDILKSGIKR